MRTLSLYLWNKCRSMPFTHIRCTQSPLEYKNVLLQHPALLLLSVLPGAHKNVLTENHVARSPSRYRRGQWCVLCPSHVSGVHLMMSDTRVSACLAVLEGLHFTPTTTGCYSPAYMWEAVAQRGSVTYPRSPRGSELRWILCHVCAVI